MSVIGVLHRRPLDFIRSPDRRRRRDPSAPCRPWPHSANVVEAPGERARGRSPCPANARRSGESSGHGAVPEFIKILEAGSRGGEVAPVDHGLGVGDGSSEVGKIHRRPESRVGRESAGTLAATKGAADRLRSSVNKAIDLRIDIVILFAAATRTGGWSASPDGGCTRIARLRGAARQEVH